MTDTRWDERELESCEPCLFVIMYGSYDNGEDDGERAAAGIARIWGDDARHLIGQGDRLDELSTRSCQTCGDDTHGTRFRVTLLKPLER